ncbi:putative uncharacterized protein DDB_G0271606 isoform X2 [Bradysia coprophila]|uniref:putative uncharacterized protein DDB_G0271606 isoform X2 n=1 Tax=Bradysia coprophila TaxID=38358 RepID=UPI00187D8F05|nr:putative uncharacterized protein DDB_G0271606 isoform X2 [Bradysia coprophila]
MAESISRDNYGNKEEEDYDSSEQSANQHTSSNNDKYDDPAILSCGSAQRENRITYERDHLLQLRNSPLSRKRPDYVLEGLTLRKLWCRATDLMIGGEERTSGRSTNNSSHEFRSSTNGTSTPASTYLMPLFAVKRRPNETKTVRKPEGNETTTLTTTSTNANNAPMRRSVFMSGPQLTSVGGNSSALDRRIGSGRIPARDSQWEFRSEKEPLDQDFSFRPTGGLINIRERERERNLSAESQQKLQQQHRAGLDRERERDYRDDRYDKRTTYSRDYDRDKDRNSSRMMGNSNNNMTGNMRFSGGSHNERRRMFSENRAEEPEWFSGGPTSQNDTIELRGFDEPEADERTVRANETVENDDQVSLDNQSDNSNNNADECEVGEPESDSVEDTAPPTVDEPNDSNNNDNLNSDKGFMDDPNNAADDFNFDNFLKMGLMSEELKESGVGESRFYRWFQRQSPTKENKSRRSSIQDDVNEGNQNNATTRPAEKYFAPISPAASTGSSNSLLEFIQLGKFDKAPKEDQNVAGTGRTNVQSNSIANNVPGSVCSVLELEARMRSSGGKSQSEVRNQQQQQDMQAFKKLLSQISGNDHGMMQREPQTMGQATGLMQMLSKNTPQPQPQQPIPFMLNHQRPQNLQPPIQRQPMDPMQNVQIGPHLQQSRDEILKRPEAQMIIQSICNAEVTQNSLIQQLNNPASNHRQRETILAVLNFISECAPRIPSPNLMPSVMQPQGAAPLLHGAGVPIPKPPTIQTNAPPNVGMNEQPNDVLQPHLLYQHHHQGAAVAAQKLRVSPLPNGIPQRIPSPRELQFHTQSIMQSALIKKKLEEQRENFRKRQEMQQAQQQQNHLNQPPNQSESGNNIPSSSVALTQTSTSSPVKQHHQHIASPTPLAFTPTSVLRKMTAEKDIDVMSNVGMGNKSTLGQIQHSINSAATGQIQQQHQQHQQQQQQQQMRANQIKWNNQFNQPPSKPIGRPIVKGGGLPMQMASNVEFQQMRDQYLRKNPQASMPQPQLPNLSQQMLQQQQQQHRQQQQQQQQQQQMRANNQIKWNQFNQPFQNQYQQQMMHHQHTMAQQKPSGSSGQSGNVLVNENHGMINFGREGGLSPTSNQLARWFSPELLAQASAGKLPSLNIGQALSLEEFERSMQHSSATVHN